MKEYIEFIVKQIVSNPDEVVITEEVDGTVVRVIISANENDLGVIIGKGGKTIQNIRSLARIKGIKDNVKVYVDIAE